MDCDLVSLDDILEKVENVGKDAIEVDVPVDEVRRTVPGSMTVEFPTLLSLMQICGPVSKVTLNAMVVTTKQSRSGTEKDFCRVIGTMYNRREQEDDGPFYIVLGREKRQTAGELERKPMVLFREKSTWNVMDNNFEFTLSMLDIAGSQLKERLSTVLEPRNTYEATKGKGICMTWRPLQQPQRTLYATTVRRTVLGRLSVQIPYLTVTGKEFFEEIVSLIR